MLLFVRCFDSCQQRQQHYWSPADEIGEVTFFISSELFCVLIYAGSLCILCQSFHISHGTQTIDCYQLQLLHNICLVQQEIVFASFYGYTVFFVSNVIITNCIVLYYFVLLLHN